MTLHPWPFPQVQQRYLALLGAMAPPDDIRADLDHPTRRALDSLATMIVAEASNGLVIRRPDVEFVAQTFNASTARRGRDLVWHMPGDGVDARYREPLGLDVPEAFGLERISLFYLGRDIPGERARAALGRVVSAATGLQDAIQRIAGFGCRQNLGVGPSLAGMRRRLETAMASPLLPRPFTVLRVPDSLWPRSYLQAVSPQPDYPGHAA